MNLLRAYSLFALVLIVAFAALVGVVHAADVADTAKTWTIANVVDTAAYLIGGAATLAAVLPVPDKAKGMLAIARNILDVLALNIGNAKNQKR